MWKKILLGYDGSEHSKKALLKAEKVAIENDALLIIANVYRELITSAFSQSLLEEAKSSVSNQVMTETVSSRNTNVGDELIEIAKRYDVDLIVVGSRGMGELRSLLLGSVSHAIANNAHVDVLIIKNLSE